MEGYTMNEMVQWLIWIHAFTGGLALATGGIALVMPKGRKWHKTGGRIFLFSMPVSAGVAIVISLWPGHYSAFLFSIGIFTIYLIAGGYRAWKMAATGLPGTFDRLLAWGMLLTGMGMIVLPLIFFRGAAVFVPAVFGATGLALAIQDLYLLSRQDKLRKAARGLHIGKMTGAYISAVTAFIVVNNFIGGAAGWLGPTVIGLIYMFWHFRNRKN